MVTVTEYAAKELKERLNDKTSSPDIGLRLLPMVGGLCILGLDNELPGDYVCTYEGYKILLIGVEYYGLFKGLIVDCEATKNGPILYLRQE
jgi:hypothetical protein